MAASALLATIQCVYWLLIYSRMWLHNRAWTKGKVKHTDEQAPISVIITARDECHFLRENLEDILRQDYPRFEVIVINEGLHDESEDFLQQMANRYPHLYHSFVPPTSKYVSRKKLAITLGIKASKYDWLVMTEASCKPAGNQWLRQMARNFTPQTEIVLGHSRHHEATRKKFPFIALDNLFDAMRSLGMAIAGYPYKGIGRNLAYRKSLFYRIKGFTEHLNLLKGDDDLFVNSAATRTNTVVECHPDSVMHLPAPIRAKEWREEKISYAHNARFYQGAQRWLLGFETTTRLLFYASTFSLLFIGISASHYLGATIGVCLFLLRWCIVALITSGTSRSVGERSRYILMVPVFDVIQPLQSMRNKLFCLFRKKSEFQRK